MLFAAPYYYYYCYSQKYVVLSISVYYVKVFTLCQTIEKVSQL